MSQKNYTATTLGIKVSVLPAVIEEGTQSSKSCYAFSYTVTIVNGSTKTVQLLDRSWKVISDGKTIAVVNGPGVIGLQPIIEPGESFSYTSGTVIEDPIGAMLGSYTFKSLSGDLFEVEIPKFDLVFEGALN